MPWLDTSARRAAEWWLLFACFCELHGYMHLYASVGGAAFARLSLEDGLAQQQLQIVSLERLPAHSPDTILPNLGQMALAATFRTDQGQDAAMPIGPAINLTHGLGVGGRLNKVLSAEAD